MLSECVVCALRGRSSRVSDWRSLRRRLQSSVSSTRHLQVTKRESVPLLPSSFFSKVARRLAGPRRSQHVGFEMRCATLLHRLPHACRFPAHRISRLEHKRAFVAKDPPSVEVRRPLLRFSADMRSSTCLPSTGTYAPMMTPTSWWRTCGRCWRRETRGSPTISAIDGTTSR